MEHLRDIEIWGTVVGGWPVPCGDRAWELSCGAPPEGFWRGLVWLMAQTAAPGVSAWVWGWVACCVFGVWEVLDN